MYSRNLIDIIRKHKVMRIQKLINSQPLTSEDFKPENPSFYIKYNAERKQYEFVK